MPKAFLCHSTNDKPFARRLNSGLLAFGIATWLDEAELRPGDSLIGKIQDGLTTSDVLIAILSPHSVTSEWCRRELRAALSMEIAGVPLRVIPVIAARCDIPPFLMDKVYVDFSGSFATGLSRLLTSYFARAEVGGIPIELVERWASRFEPRDERQFTAFVQRELQQKELLSQERRRVSRQVRCLLRKSALSDSTARTYLEEVGEVYGGLSRCSKCNTLLVDTFRLVWELQRTGASELPYGEIATRLWRYCSGLASLVGTEKCWNCFKADYRDE